ncbi:hypothetical protein ABIC29_002763 [Agromyces sp. PvR057]
MSQSPVVPAYDQGHGVPYLDAPERYLRHPLD